MKNSKKGILEFKQSLDKSQLISFDKMGNIKGGGWFDDLVDAAVDFYHGFVDGYYGD